MIKIRNTKAAVYAVVLMMTLLQAGSAVFGQIQTPILINHFSGTKMPLPPAEHPRLLVRKSQISELKKNFQHEELKGIWERVVTLSNNNNNPLLKIPADSVQGNFNADVIKVIQAKALLYLVENDKEKGRKAIDLTAAFLHDVVFPDKMDITRRIGETIMTAALVYDWCYELMKHEEKLDFIKHLKKLASAMEIGYPPVKQGSVTGHGSEAQLMRDLLAAGIAVYDEDKEIYQLSAAKFFEDFVPIRNYWYKSQMHHQGDSYGAYRYQWEMFAAIMFDRMGYKDIFIKDQAKIPYRWIYTRRPDGQLLRDGDSFIAAQTPRGNYWSSPFHLLLASGYYKDQHLKAEFTRQYKYTLGRYNIDDIWMLLFNDPEVKPVSNPQLPLTKYFDDPSGTMVARTSWDTGINARTVVAEMKIGGIWFANHQHLDAGQFQIYYKGGLAIDAGIYEGTKGAYGSEHDMHYHKRAIAHNTMLVYNPEEIFTRGRIKLSNDGGQRIPNFGYEAVKGEDLFQKGYRVAQVMAHHIGPDKVKPDFSYLKGDLTKAYSGKVADFKRSFVFLNLKNDEYPAVMIVFDQVTSSNAAFKKTWLLHSIEEPVLQGNRVTINRTEYGHNGRLLNTTLLPPAKNLNINKVGGAGRPFEIGGVNYEQYVHRANSSEEAGDWRVEVSPVKPELSDRFLNVIQVMDNDDKRKPMEIKMIENKSQVGVRVADRVILFSKSDKLSQRLEFTIDEKTNKNFKIFIADLAPGNWQLKKSGINQLAARVDAESGTFYFEGKGGSYSLELR